MPFPNDTPDFIVRALLTRHGLADTVEITPRWLAHGSGATAAEGRTDAAVLTELVATVVGPRAKEAGKSIVFAIDIQAEWGNLSGLGPVVPQVGLGVTEKLLTGARRPCGPAAAGVDGGHRAGARRPSHSGRHAAAPLEQPAQMLTQSILHCNLTAMPASELRPALEAMFNLMSASAPAIFGGKLPDDGFYVL